MAAASVAARSSDRTNCIYDTSTAKPTIAMNATMANARSGITAPRRPDSREPGIGRGWNMVRPESMRNMRGCVFNGCEMRVRGSTGGYSRTIVITVVSVFPPTNQAGLI